MCVILITRLLLGVGRWVRKPVNHTSWMAIVTPTDRPKSVRNCSLIELFCGVVCVATLPLWHFCWYRAFVIGLGQISSFLSWSLQCSGISVILPLVLSFVHLRLQLQVYGVVVLSLNIHARVYRKIRLFDSANRHSQCQILGILPNIFVYFEFLRFFFFGKDKLFDNVCAHLQFEVNILACSVLGQNGFIKIYS